MNPILEIDMKIKTIASSSVGCCYLVEHAGEQLLIECGISLREIRKALNFDLARVRACLVSHFHGDHSRSAERLQKETVVHVYGPEGGATQPLQPGVYHRFGGFTVRAHELEHDRKCFGYEISAGRAELFYISDSRFIPEIKPPIHYLMIEANHSFKLLLGSDKDRRLLQRIYGNHLDIDSAVEFAKRHKSTLKEVHLLHLSDDHSDEEQFKKQMAEAVGVPVYVAAKGI